MTKADNRLVKIMLIYEFLYITDNKTKIAQCTLKEHKGYLMGYESDVVRDGGFGSTGDER